MNIQLTRTGARFYGGSSALKRAQKEFQKKHVVLLKQFLEPSLLKQIQKTVSSSRFYTNKHKDIALEDCMVRNSVYNLLQFLANDEKVFEVIRRITGCKPIGCYNGRVYRMRPGQGHYDTWHSDIDQKNGRLIGMSVNLSVGTYKGGALQIRNCDNNKILHEVANTGFVDAILFRIAPFLEHQLTDVKGVEAKVAYAGWFQAKPEFRYFLKRRPQHFASNAKDLSLDSRLKPTRDAAFRSGNRVAAVLNSKTGLYYHLDEVGNKAWEVLNQNNGRVRSVYDHLARNYNVSAKRLERDVLKLMGDLSANGLLE